MRPQYLGSGQEELWTDKTFESADGLHDNSSVLPNYNSKPVSAYKVDEAHSIDSSKLVATFWILLC